MLLFCIISTALLTGFSSKVKAQPTTLYVAPAIINVQTGDFFTMNFSISDVTDLWGWEAFLTFDPSQINCVGAEEGPFLRSRGPTNWMPPVIDNVAGTIHMACNLLISPGASGSGILAYIHFRCVGIGTSFIHIQDSFLFDSFGIPIPHVRLDSQVNQYQAQTGYGPRASQLEIQFYESQEQAFAALMANETDLMNSEANAQQAMTVSSVKYLQIGGIHHGWYEVPRNTWAVLVAGGVNQGSNYARYWNDLGECYTMLKEKGYVDSEIYVLYANGNTPSSANCYDPTHVYSQYSNMIIDYAATKANLQKVCQFIQGNASSQGYDTLFVFTTDHGSTSGGSSSLNLWGESISAADFAGTSYFGQVTTVSLRIFLMEQCYSGGFINALKDSKTIIATAVDKDNWSWSCDNEGYYDEFSFHYIAALRGKMPDGTAVNADSDANGIVSLQEAFNYANSTDSQKYVHTSYGNGAPYKGDNPQWSDQGGHTGAPLPTGHYALVPKSDELYGTHYMPVPPPNQNAGPDNYWTFLRANTTTGTIRYALAGIPESMNVITATSRNEWDCLNRIYDSLLMFSPYDQSIRTGLRPRMAWNWQLENWTREVINEPLFIDEFVNSTIREYRIQTYPLVEYSETIYKDGFPLTRGVDYTIDYSSGIVYFAVQPPPTSTLTADYLASCTKVTFQLRNNIFWHDGTPCTAEDVYFTIEYIRNFPEIASNYHLVKNVHHAEMLDPYTIAVYEDMLNSCALWWIGSLPIIPMHIFQTITDPTGYTPGNLPPEQVLIGCGAWRYQFINPTSNMILIANRGYYLKTPPIGEVDYYMQMDYVPLNPRSAYQVNILDIVRICIAYSSKGYGVPDENFDPGCDINPGGHTCTVNILDVVSACIAYGETWGTDGIPPP